MAEIKVSVIIPVYNSENFLTQCLESICNQTLKEIEIICVDDGSTDSSPEILEMFAKKDSRIQVLHQKNLYAGVARNTGKACAKGKYLVFWDSDDFFAPDALEKMYHKCITDDADICVCGAYQYYEQDHLVSPSRSYLRMKWVPAEIPFNRESNSDYIMNFTVPAAWNKMFRRRFVEETGLNFQAVRNGNDVFFDECALCYAQRITIINERLIYYRKDQANSLLGTIQKAPLSAIQAWGDVRARLEEDCVLPEKSFLNAAISNIRHLLGHISMSYSALQEAVNYLKREGLERIGIHEPLCDCFYDEENEVFVKSLLNDSLEQFTSAFLARTYMRMNRIKAERVQLNAKLKESNKQIKELKDSKAYRIGTRVVWLPKKIKSLFQRKHFE